MNYRYFSLWPATITFQSNFFADDFVSVNHTSNFQTSFLNTCKSTSQGSKKSEPAKRYINYTKNATSPESKREMHTKHPWKTANLPLPARTQTLAGKVSCFLIMPKLGREKSEQSYPVGSRASSQKGSMGSQESRAETVRTKGEMCSPVRVAPRVSEAERVGMFVCGTAGTREAASRQGTWQPLPADTAAGLLHRAG